MKHIVKDNYLYENNISMSIEKMPNTETRYRIKIDNNTLYSITKSGEKLSWQNSHYHKECNELYLVQKGKALIIMQENEKISKKIIKEGEMITIKPNISHNIYMFEDTQTCVLKYGDVKQNDWYSDEKLDNICKEINIEKI